MLLTVRDSSGTPVRIAEGPVKQGFHRVAWDLRLPAHVLPPNRPRGEESDFFGGGPTGPYAVPGEYSVTLSQRVGGVVTQLAGPVSFHVALDPQVPLTGEDEQARGAFQARLQDLRRRRAGALALASTTQQKLGQMRKALDLAPAAPADLGTRVRAAEQQLSGILIASLVNRDAPVVYGSVSGVMDMKAGSAAVGGPEFGLLSAASVQLSHFYGIPCSSGGQSDARVHGIQASIEKGTTLLASILAGADFVDLYFGSYEGFNATSPEQVLIDHEIAGYANRYAQGIEVDSASLSLDLMEAVGPGGSYLKNPRALRDTMAMMGREWYLPALFDRRTPDGPDRPEEDLLQMAHEAVARILREHEPTPLDPGLLKEMKVILEAIRKEENGSPAAI